MNESNDLSDKKKIYNKKYYEKKASGGETREYKRRKPVVDVKQDSKAIANEVNREEQPDVEINDVTEQQQDIKIDNITEHQKQKKQRKITVQLNKDEPKQSIFQNVNIRQYVIPFLTTVALPLVKHFFLQNYLVQKQTQNQQNTQSQLNQQLYQMNQIQNYRLTKNNNNNIQNDINYLDIIE